MSVKNNSAFSLMEVLVSLFVMSVAVLALISVLVTGLRGEEQSSARMVARELAEQQWQRAWHGLLEGAGREETDTFWEGEFSPESGSSWKKGEAAVGSTHYNYYIYASTVPLSDGVDESDGARLKKVDVLVKWGADREQGGKSSNFLSLTHLVHRS